MRKFLICFLLFGVGTIFGVVLTNYYNDAEPHHGLYKDFLPELAKDENSPIKYNSKVEEYQIVYETQNNNKKTTLSIPLYYSPFTGEKLTSGRSKLFTKPSSSEMQKIATKIQGVKTLEEIEQKLGKPDSVFHNTTDDIKTQYTYSNLSESTQVVIQLHNDGKLTFAYSGKYNEE